MLCIMLNMMHRERFNAKKHIERQLSDELLYINTQ